jgi:hypothetical protein
MVRVNSYRDCMPKFAPERSETRVMFYPFVVFLANPKIFKPLFTIVAQKSLSETLVPGTIGTCKKLVRIDKLVRCLCRAMVPQAFMSYQYGDRV